jgi:hypothetical protein
MSTPPARVAAIISHTAQDATVVKVREKVANIAKTKVVSIAKMRVNTVVMIAENIAKKTISMMKRTMIKPAEPSISLKMLNVR